MVQSARSRNVLTLYTLADDVQCHRARLVLAAKGVSYERVIVDRDKASAELAELNPYGTTPTLVDRDLVNLARSFNATRLQVFWKIEFRAAMPALFSGLRIGSTLAVIGVVVGELVGGNTGLGYLPTYGEGAADTPMVFVAIILLTIIGIIAYLAVILLEKRVLHYIPQHGRGPEGI